jgi:hypothetical protein
MTDPLVELERQLRQGVRNYAAETRTVRRRWWRRTAALLALGGVVGTGATVAAFGLDGAAPDPTPTPEGAISVLRSGPPEVVPKNNALSLLAQPAADDDPRAAAMQDAHPVQPDLTAARSVVVSGKRFWITTSVDRQQACIAGDAADGPTGVTCSPLMNLADGQPGIFMTTRPGPGSKASARVVGLVPDSTKGVRVLAQDRTTSYHEANSNIVYIETEELPVSIQAILNDGTAGATLPIRASR